MISESLVCRDCRVAVEDMGGKFHCPVCKRLMGYEGIKAVSGD